MAQTRLSMRKVREVLRLRAEGFSEREIARSVDCARSSVQICLWRADKAGLSWPLAPECRISSHWTHLISSEWNHPISGEWTHPISG